MTRNEQLRAHVTRVGFQLSLTKNQIAELVWLDIQLSDPRPVGEQIHDGPHLDNTLGRHILSNHIATRSALYDRGLIIHHPPADRTNRDDRWLRESMRDRYSFTEAGRLVVELLKQSGLWDDVAAEIPWTVKPEARSAYTADEEIKHLRARLEQATAEMEQARKERDEQARAASRAHEAQMRAEHKLARLQEQVRDLVTVVAA